MEIRKKYFIFLDTLVKKGNVNVSIACQHLCENYELSEADSINIFYEWIKLRDKDINLIKKR